MIETIVVFIIGFVLGHKMATWFHVAAFKKILEELGVTNDQLRKLGLKAARDLGVKPPKELEESAASDLEEIHIKLEQHQGQIYAFRIDNDQFLAQGTDREALIEALKNRMTGVRLIVDQGGDLIQKTKQA